LINHTPLERDKSLKLNLEVEYNKSESLNYNELKKIGILKISLIDDIDTLQDFIKSEITPLSYLTSRSANLSDKDNKKEKEISTQSRYNDEPN